MSGMSTPETYSQLRQQWDKLKRKREELEVEIEQCEKKIKVFPEWQKEQKQNEAKQLADKICTKLIGSCVDRKCASASNPKWLDQQKRLVELVHKHLVQGTWTKTVEKAKGGYYATETVLNYTMGSHNMECRIWDCPDADVRDKTLKCVSHQDQEPCTSCDQFTALYDDPIHTSIRFEELEARPELIPAVFLIAREYLGDDICYCDTSTQDELCIDASD